MISMLVVGIINVGWFRWCLPGFSTEKLLLFPFPPFCLEGNHRVQGFPGGAGSGQRTHLPAQEMSETLTLIWSPGQADPLEEGMATHSRILAWRIPWTEEPGGLQSMGSQRVRLYWATQQACTKHSPFPGEENEAPPLEGGDILFVTLSMDISFLFKIIAAYQLKRIAQRFHGRYNHVILFVYEELLNTSEIVYIFKVATVGIAYILNIALFLSCLYE